MRSILSSIITSKTRVKILMRLYFNPDREAYLRELATEFSLSPSQVREELRQLHRAGILQRAKNGRRINYRANPDHPLFPELHSMVQKALGMDQIMALLVGQLDNVERAYVIDDYAEGKDTGIIDVVIVGNIKQDDLIELVRKTETKIDRKIRTLILMPKEWAHLKKKLLTRPLMRLGNTDMESVRYN